MRRSLLVVLVSVLVGAQDAQKSDLTRGMEALARADFEVAASAFQKCATDDVISIRLRCLQYLGHSYFELKRYDDAIAAYQKALGIDNAAKALTLEERRVVVDQAGMSYGISGKLAEARDWYVRALRDDPQYPNYLYNLACAFAELGDLPQAINNLRLAWKYRDHANPGESLADPRIDASFERFRDDPRFSSLMVEFYGESIKDREAAEKRIQEILSKNQDKDLESAVRAFKEVQAIAHAAALPEREVFALGLIARLYSTVPNYAEALSYYQQALDVVHANHLSGESELLLSIGTGYQQLGSYEQAAAKYDEAVESGKKNGDWASVADGLDQKGVLLVQMGRYAEALRLLSQARSQAEGLHDPDVSRLAWIRNDIGGAYASVGNWPLALDNYLAAARVVSEELARLNKSRPANQEKIAMSLLEETAAAAWNNVGSARSHLKDYTEALDAYQKAAELIPAILDPSLPGRIINNMGEAYAMLGRDEEAISKYREALELKVANKDVLGQSVTLSNIAAMYDRERNYDKAEAVLKDALVIAKGIGSIVEQSELYDALGVVYEHQKKPQQALAAYKRSIDQRETVRSGTLSPMLKSTQALFSADAYERAILLQLQLGDEEGAFNTSESARARSFLDQVGSGRVRAGSATIADLSQKERSLRAELDGIDGDIRNAGSDPQRLRVLIQDRDRKERDYEDLLNQIRVRSPDYASAIGVNPLNLAAIQPLVPRGSVLISYFVAESETLAFIIHRDRGVQVRHLAAGRENLQRSVAEFHPFASFAKVPAALDTLFTSLIEPLVSELNANTLLIAPHGPLHLVPFAALRSADGIWLSQRHSIVEVPSASVLQLFGHRPKKAEQPLAVLSFSNPTGPQQLRYADKECSRIASKFGVKPVIGATELDFFAKAPNARILHIAAHGELNAAQPSFSRLLLRPDATHDGSIEVNKIYDLDLSSTELVVLSACETGNAVVNAGDEAVALNRAFLIAGAGSVLATLWPVDDESTSILMERFYNHLKRGANRAAALKQAQDDLRKCCARKYVHPYYWAGFVLSGDFGAK